MFQKIAKRDGEITNFNSIMIKTENAKAGKATGEFGKKRIEG
jgi:hypothetical protein